MELGAFIRAKAKLFVCLTMNYDATEGICRRWDTVPCLLNLGSMWRWVVQEAGWALELVLPLTRMELRLLCRPARSLVTISTALSWLLEAYKAEQIKQNWHYISGSNSSKYEDRCILGCDAVKSGSKAQKLQSSSIWALKMVTARFSWNSVGTLLRTRFFWHITPRHWVISYRRFEET